VTCGVMPKTACIDERAQQPVGATKAASSNNESRELRRLLAYLGVCKPSRAATNLAIDDRLLNEARKVGGHKTKKATVTEALTEYIQRRKQQKILGLFGKISIDAAYDYKP
jgi:hypothetical protein